MNSNKRLWPVLLLAMIALSCLGHGMTSRYSPPFWVDEAQIVDGGRIALCNGSSDYSITWVRPGRPFQFLYYFGCVLQELAYRNASIGELGPRLASIGGAALAAVVLYSWLRARGGNRLVSAACGLAFFWDPLFTQGFRGGRVDCWAIGLFIASLWVLRKYGLKNPRPGKLLTCTSDALAGVLIGISGMTWISSVLLIPLFVSESVSVIWTRFSSCRDRVVQLLVSWAIVGVGATAILCIGLIPMRTALATMCGDAGNNITNATSHFNLLGMVVESLSAFPFVLPVAVLGMLRRGSAVQTLSLLAAAGIVAATRPYAHRLVYLLPYLIVAIADGAVARVQTTQASFNLRKWLPALLAILVCVHAGISLVYRNVNALVDWRARDPALIDNLCASIDEGAPVVAFIPYELYFAARKRGWQYFHVGTSLIDEPALLARLDLAVFRADDPLDPGIGRMRECGFSHQVCDLKPGGAQPPKMLDFLWRGRHYGPYIAYKKIQSPNDQ